MNGQKEIGSMSRAWLAMGKVDQRLTELHLSLCQGGTVFGSIVNHRPR